MTDKPDFVEAWTEPESAANTDYQPVYPYNNVTQTPGGHSFELDDTPTRERIRLQHGQGTFFEMHPNGDQVTKIIGDGYTIILGDHNIAIGIDDGNNAKKLNLTVYGDVNMHVTGDKIEQIDGNYELYVKGNYIETVEGIKSMSSFGNMDITAGAALSGKLTITVPDYVRVNGDITATGEMTANKIASKTRVDAGTGMSAGPLGFVTLTGGVSVGIPAAVPLQINCAGAINSLLSVNAPFGNFIYNKGLLSYDTTNQLIRNSHIHIDSKGGATTPPLSSEVTGP